MNDKHSVVSPAVRDDLDPGSAFADMTLATKSQPPLLRTNRILRPRLVDRLAEGVANHRRLTLVSAPAGFGKTTLVNEWISAGERPAAWLSLDEGDNDPARFLTYLIAALQRVDAQLGRAALSLSGPAPSNIIPLIMNDVSAYNEPLCLVLDDYQAITGASVHQMLHMMLQHQPPHFHLVIITREDPPLPLARMRAQSQITEIRERDLRFRLDEIASFLRQTMGLELSSGAVEALEARTEGWIAGLQLAALALHENPVDVDEFIRAFTGSDRYIMDYLVSEVIDRQPETIRSFLRQTAILDRMNADLCDAVTGRMDSRAILDSLDKANLFIVPLDHRREWYRYHWLFAEVLRATLPRAEQVDLRVTASRWYEQNGMLAEAVEHLRACVSLSGHMEEYIQLVIRAAEEPISQGSGQTVQQWLEAVPEDRIRQEPLLAGIKGWTFVLSGEMDLANEYAEIASARSAVSSLSSPMILALDAFLAVLYHQDYERAIGLSSRALQDSEGAPGHWELILLWALAESQERTRPIAEAIATLRKASRMGHTRNPYLATLILDQTLAMALHSSGSRLEAVAVCLDRLEQHQLADGRLSPAGGVLLSRLGLLHYEANELDEARECHERSLLLAEQLGFDSLTVLAYGAAAPTLAAQGEIERALGLVERAAHLNLSPTDLGWLRAQEADIRLRLGDRAFVKRWIAQSGFSPQDEPTYLRIEEQVVYARAMIALNQIDEAQAWLGRLEMFTLERGLHRWRLSALILQALAAERAGDRRLAREKLELALEIAAPERCIRVFLDEDQEVIHLLPAVRHIAPEFVDEVLESAGRVPGALAHDAQPLDEPLSERELEVLALLAEGRSNIEIAGRLFITVGTVKRHINHIYGKLEVGSRTQAVAKARELRLLG